MIFFNPHDESDPAIILEHNYYMIYILKALNLFDLDINNITSFIQQNIDYGNIKNIYYCYKIDDILDLKIDFDINLTSTLVGQLYSENINEFYEDLDRQIINQEIFLWICEMARNDDIYIQCTYKKSVNLGSVNTITASFSNLIFLEYGQLTSVRFESDQFGILDLEKQFDNSYQINFMIPEDPKFYPSVEGNLKIYDHFKLIGQFPISFQTNFEQKIECSPIEKEDSLEIYINVSRKFSAHFEPVNNSNVVVHIFLENTYLESKNFTREDFEGFSKFSFIYEYIIKGAYKFELTFFDEFYPQGLFLFEYDTQKEEGSHPIPEKSIEANGWLLVVVTIAINIALVIGVIKGGRWVKVKLKEDGKREPIKKTEPKIQKREHNNMLEELKQSSSFKGWD